MRGSHHWRLGSRPHSNPPSVALCVLCDSVVNNPPNPHRRNRPHGVNASRTLFRAILPATRDEVPAMNGISSGLGLVATAAWWSMSTNGIESALDSAGLLNDDVRAGFDELDTVAAQGLRLGIELTKGELVGSFIDKLG